MIAHQRRPFHILLRVVVHIGWIVIRPGEVNSRSISQPYKCDEVFEFYDRVMGMCSSCLDLCSRGPAASEQCDKRCTAYVEYKAVRQQTSNNSSTSDTSGNSDSTGENTLPDPQQSETSHTISFLALTFIIVFFSILLLIVGAVNYNACLGRVCTKLFKQPGQAAIGFETTGVGTSPDDIELSPNIRTSVVEAETETPQPYREESQQLLNDADIYPETTSPVQAQPESLSCDVVSASAASLAPSTPHSHGSSHSQGSNTKMEAHETGKERLQESANTDETIRLKLSIQECDELAASETPSPESAVALRESPMMELTNAGAENRPRSIVGHQADSHNSNVSLLPSLKYFHTSTDGRQRMTSTTSHDSGCINTSNSACSLKRMDGNHDASKPCNVEGAAELQLSSTRISGGSSGAYAKENQGGGAHTTRFEIGDDASTASNDLKRHPSIPTHGSIMEEENGAFSNGAHQPVRMAVVGVGGDRAPSPLSMDVEHGSSYDSALDSEGSLSEDSIPSYSDDGMNEY